MEINEPRITFLLLSISTTFYILSYILLKTGDENLEILGLIIGGLGATASVIAAFPVVKKYFLRYVLEYTIINQKLKCKNKYRTILILWSLSNSELHTNKAINNNLHLIFTPDTNPITSSKAVIGDFSKVDIKAENDTSLEIYLHKFPKKSAHCFNIISTSNDIPFFYLESGNNYIKLKKVPENALLNSNKNIVISNFVFSSMVLLLIGLNLFLDYKNQISITEQIIISICSIIFIFAICLFISFGRKQLKRRQNIIKILNNLKINTE